MPTATATYPQPGSNAERVLNHLLVNPGLSTNALITTLGMNPTVVRKCLRGLESHEKIRDRPDGNGNHRWSPK